MYLSNDELNIDDSLTRVNWFTYHLCDKLQKKKDGSVTGNYMPACMQGQLPTVLS